MIASVKMTPAKLIKVGRRVHPDGAPGRLSAYGYVDVDDDRYWFSAACRVETETLSWDERDPSRGLIGCVRLIIAGVCVAYVSNDEALRVARLIGRTQTKMRAEQDETVKRLAQM